MIKLTSKYHNEDLFPTKIREWPKYSTQLLNLCNQNGRGTTPKNIGSLKELWTRMVSEGIRPSVENWFDYLNDNYGHEIVEGATDRIWSMAQKMDLDHKLTKDMCHDYAMEIIYIKTALGMAMEEQAVMRAAEYLKSDYRLSTKEEESQGIDAWINKIPVQVKPDDYNNLNRSHMKVDQTLLLLTYSTKDKTFCIQNPEILEN